MVESDVLWRMEVNKFVNDVHEKYNAAVYWQQFGHKLPIMPLLSIHSWWKQCSLCVPSSCCSVCDIHLNTYLVYLSVECILSHILLSCPFLSGLFRRCSLLALNTPTLSLLLSLALAKDLQPIITIKKIANNRAPNERVFWWVSRLLLHLLARRHMNNEMTNVRAKHQQQYRPTDCLSAQSIYTKHRSQCHSLCFPFALHSIPFHFRYITRVERKRSTGRATERQAEWNVHIFTMLLVCVEVGIQFCRSYRQDNVFTRTRDSEMK